MIFDAGTLATAWLSVAQASSTDKLRPALCRTVLVEEYPHGVQLVATDSYMLLRSWVPFQGVDSLSLEAEPPELYEGPERSSVVMDPDGRGKQLLSWARSLANRCDEFDDRPELRVQVGVAEHSLSSAAQAFDGMDPTWAKLKLDAEEEVRLQLYEGEWPNWRSIIKGLEPVETKSVALGPSIMERLAKVSKLHGDRVWGWRFCGEVKPAAIEVIDASPPVDGCAMPCRWDLSANEPYVDPDPEAGDDA
jgi:hypothetical protein